MAITTLEGMISGLQNPIDFVQGLTGGMVAGIPIDLFCAPVSRAKKWQKSWMVQGTTPGTTTVVYTLGTHDFTVGQEVTFSGSTSGVPHELDGATHLITATGVKTFTISTTTTTNPGGLGCCSCCDIGSPGIGGTKGTPLTSHANQIPFSNPALGNTYLARLQAQAGVAGTLLLCDRLWHNSGINSMRIITNGVFPSTAQIPARDINGTNNGVGVFAALEVHGTFSGSNSFVGVLTGVSYTNQDGTTGRTATMIHTPAAVPAPGTFWPLALQEGDTGVRQVNGISISTQFDDLYDYEQTDCLGVVLYRVLARLPLRANTRNAIDALTGAFPRLFDATVPFLVFIPAATTSSYVMGHVQYSQG